jgi:outer membrane biogenesis lipoprotein LolB
MSKFSFLIFICLLLTSCGGGGSDSGGNSGGSNPPANKIPTVNAGNEQTVDEQTSVTLTGTAADSDGSISSYSWTQTAGTTVTLSNDISASASFIAPDINADETLTFKLTVTDNDGANANDSVSIIVKRVNELPTVNAGNDQTVDEQTSVTLTGSAADSDGLVSSYSWTQTSGATVILSNADTANASFIAPSTVTNETLTFQLTVSDNDGAEKTNSVDVTIIAVNALPFVDAGMDQNLLETKAISIESVYADEDGAISSFFWEQTSGTNVTIEAPNTSTLSFMAPFVEEDSDLTFSITVIDNEGGSAKDFVSVSIKNIEVQKVNVILPDFIYDYSSLSVISNLSGQTELSISPSNIQKIDDELLMVVDAEDNIVLLIITDSSKAEQIVNSESTAFAILALQPGLAEYSNDLILDLRDEIAALPEFTLLSEAINTTEGWSTFSDEVFLNTYQNALIKTVDVIKTSLSNPISQLIDNTNSKKNIKTSYKVGSPNLGSSSNTLVANKGVDEYGWPLSGVSITLSGQVSSAGDPKFKLKFFNSLHRFVYIVVGQSEHDYGKRGFLMDSDTSFEYVESYSNKLIDETESGAYIHAYGPGTGNLVQWIQGEEDYFIQASVASLIEYYFIPSASKLLGAPESCLRNVFFDVELNSDDLIELSRFKFKSEVIAKLASESISPLVKGDYLQASAKIFGQVGIHYFNDLQLCAAEAVKAKSANWIEEGSIDIIKIMVKNSLSLLIELKKAYDLLDALGAVDDRFLRSIEQAPKSDFWTVTNEFVQNNELISVSSLNALDISWPASLLPTHKYEPKYDCQEEEICKYFVYQRDEIPKIVFDARCDNWGYYDECSHLIIEFGDGESIGGSKSSLPSNLSAETIVHSYLPYDGYFIKSPIMSVRDFDGAFGDYQVIIELEEAMPELVITVDGQLYEKGINSIFDCKNGEILTKNIMLTNIGFGNLYLRENNLIGDSPSWAWESVGDDVILSQGDVIEVKLVNDCSDKNDQLGWGITYKDKESENYNQSIDFEINSNKYTIELTHSETQEVFADLSAGDSFTHQNGSIAVVGIKLNGQPVNTDALNSGVGWWDGELARIYMPTGSYQDDDITFEHIFKLYDRTNNVPVNIPVTYTISNQAYRSLVGGTFAFSGDGLYVYGFESGSSITFKNDGTFEAKTANGDVGQLGNYGWINDYSTYSTVNGNSCGPEINSEIIGMITFSIGNGVAYVGIKKGGGLYDYRCKINF